MQSCLLALNLGGSVTGDWALSRMSPGSWHPVQQRIKAYTNCKVANYFIQSNSTDQKGICCQE